MSGRGANKLPDGNPPGCCSRCQQLMSYQGLLQLLSDSGFEHLTRQECGARAKEGCSLCRGFCSMGVLWKDEDLMVLSLEPRIDDVDNVEALLSGKPDDIVSALARRRRTTSALVGRAKSKPGAHPLLNASLYTTDEDLAARFITSRQVLGYEDEAAVLAAAREWIDDCRHSHDCTWPSSGSNSVTLPSRLIDVGDDTIAPDVRLHTTRSGETLEYVALSYCWGGPQPVTTTLANLGSMEQRIPLTKLPKTLQYAVRLTRSVGQRYLWVDALCIIQDSGEDMRREIQKMGSIYRNAVFTISAARASKVSEGFLGRQPESTPLPSVRWQLDIPGMGMHTIFISTWYGQPGYWPKHPLDRRGWTLQESMLSPRLMVFSEYEPIWHCRAVQGKTAKASVIEYANLSRRLPDWFFAEQADPDNPWKFSRIQMPALWESIVKNFTGRALTNKEDRLDAVAGISAELQRRSKDDYFYGHWRECFVRQLLWHVFPSSVSLEERRRRAPTWSWGSVDGTVYYDIGSLTLQDEATAQVTVNAAGGFPRVWVTLKIKRRDAFANEPVKCHFDLADQDSDPPSDAVMLFLATSTLVRRSDAGYGIICVQSNKQSDTLQRIGYFEPRDVPTEELRDSGIWEGVELRQILLE